MDIIWKNYRNPPFSLLITIIPYKFYKSPKSLIFAHQINVSALILLYLAHQINVSTLILLYLAHQINVSALILLYLAHQISVSTLILLYLAQPCCSVGSLSQEGTNEVTGPFRR